MHRLRPMDYGDIFDMAIKLYRANFFTFLGIVAIVLAPAYILMSYYISLIYNPLEMWNGLLMLYLVLFIFMGLLWPVSETAITKAISERFMEHEISISEAYRFVLKKIWIILATFLIGAFVITLGTLFCVIPGILFSLWLCFLPQVMVLEGVGFIEAMGRSKKIFQQSPGKTLILLILITIMAYIVNFVAAALSNIATGLIFADPQHSIFAANIISDMVSMLFVPFSQAVITLLYYDIRIRKEGFDLDVLAASLGYANPALQCPICKEPYREEDIFCGNCGKRLKIPDGHESDHKEIKATAEDGENCSED